MTFTVATDIVRSGQQATTEQEARRPPDVVTQPRRLVSTQLRRKRSHDLSQRAAPVQRAHDSCGTRVQQHPLATHPSKHDLPRELGEAHTSRQRDDVRERYHLATVKPAVAWTAAAVIVTVWALHLATDLLAAPRCHRKRSVGVAAPAVLSATGGKLRQQALDRPRCQLRRETPCHRSSRKRLSKPAALRYSVPNSGWWTGHLPTVDVVPIDFRDPRHIQPWEGSMSTDHPIGAEGGPPPSGVSRRTLLVGGTAVAGAAWAAPTILSASRAFAATGSTVVPSPTVGTFVSTAGANTISPSIPTGDLFLLVVAVASDSDKDESNLTWESGTAASYGWTPLVTETKPGFYVFVGNAASTAPALAHQSSNNDRFAAQIFGFSGVSSATAGTPLNSTSSTLQPVPGISGQQSSTIYALIGTASTSTNAWTTPTGYTESSSQAANPTNGPSIYFGMYNSVGTSVPAATGFKSGGSPPEAWAVQVALN